MEYKALENLSSIDRMVRTITGIVITLTVLMIPLSATGIAVVCMVAAYFLLTGLIAIDPFIAVFSAIKHGLIINGKGVHQV